MLRYPGRMPHIIKSVDAFLVILSAVLAVATCAAMFARVHWTFDTVANLRIQGLITIVVILVISLLMQRWWIAGSAAGLLLINLAGMNLGTLDDSAELDPRDSIRVVTTNVLTGNRQHDKIINELLAINADVIAIIELSPNLADRLQKSFAESHPHYTFDESDTDNFGIGVLSKRPIRSTQKLRWQGTPNSLEVLIDDYRLIATHPIPPLGQANFHTRNRQLAELAKHIRATANGSGRTILLGDFNLTPWNANFTDFQKSSGLKRAAACWEIRPSWYARPLFPFGLLIDHILISDDLACSKYDIGRDCGSDHRSVAVSIGPKTN
ncbi:endonuclease/exonuclease/phosphatase family protein [Aporhodopirellula aestuarii]|uniref:Endonuclease/exonuclease/phosphatase family protein n=1 Tax=Aporhodopirellula aestuarii TaxID=2950107 RepID=A0ABT0U7I7_9BACT|nr:endonuclease/exonuclease/phosphatase family protein [Aporhodopirellula aestuarii]MCM2372912.1 endonuclease/exonuclease/phosphatase family protein [Aporhodopirellula aestuarii]